MISSISSPPPTLIPFHAHPLSHSYRPSFISFHTLTPFRDVTRFFAVFATHAMERLRISNKRTTTDITTLILTAMLEHAPSNDGKQNISEDVIKSSNLSELADLYASTLLIPMLARGGKTTSHPDSRRI